MEFLDPALNQLEAYWVNFLKLLPQIGLAILVLTATAIMSKFSGRLAYWLLGGVRTRPALREAVRALIGVGVWVVGVLLAAVVVFPSYLLHRITPVTSGTRQSLVVWVSGVPFH